jgi:hypothetical protein
MAEHYRDTAPSEKALAPTDPRIRIRARFTDDGRTDVTVHCGASRIEMAFWGNRPIPIDAIDRELITLVIAQLLTRGVSAGRIRSIAGRLAVYALAKHVRYSMESEAPVYDFGGLPIVAELPRERRLLSGITKVEVAA